jgi:hypothetical protein
VHYIYMFMTDIRLQNYSFPIMFPPL